MKHSFLYQISDRKIELFRKTNDYTSAFSTLVENVKNVDATRFSRSVIEYFYQEHEKFIDIITKNR